MDQQNHTSLDDSDYHQTEIAHHTTNQPTSALTETFADPANNGDVTFLTFVPQPQTSGNGLIAGTACCHPNGGWMALHRHAQPELYHITAGKGRMTIEGQEREVKPGDVVYIPPNAEHGIVNDSPSEELRWLYVFPGNSFEEVKYRWTAQEESTNPGQNSK